MEMLAILAFVFGFISGILFLGSLDSLVMVHDNDGVLFASYKDRLYRLTRVEK